MRSLKKVIVIGLDGLEPTIVEPMLEAGQLPALRAAGNYTRVRTTSPVQTPVAWSTFATGTNPGGHGVFDFIRRDPETYLPLPALNQYQQKNPFLPPRVTNLRRGTPLWDLLARAGHSSTVLRCPCTYPPDAIRGRMLSGMGIPDLRGGLGTPTFYSSDPGIRPGEGEQAVRLQPDSAGRMTTHVIGPRNSRAASDYHFPLTIETDQAEGRLVILSDGQPSVLEVREGMWSGWLRVEFRTGLLQAVHGTVRFFLNCLSPQVELYAYPLNFDADAPPFPISSPPSYAAELAARLGTFYTAGMVEEHSRVTNGRLSEDRDLSRTLAGRHLGDYRAVLQQLLN